MVKETSIIKVGQQDNFHSLFYAEDPNGNFQVAHSDATFTGSADFQTPDVQAALNVLVDKLQALGWQQVVGVIPNPWYNLTFEREVQGPPSIKTAIVKAGQQDTFHNLFFAETLDGSFQVAHSDKTFIGSADFQTPDVQAALDDLVAKLQALGWQQVVGTLPSPWYSLTFQQLVYPTLEYSIVKAGQQNPFHNLFFAEALNGGLQVASSDITFSGSPDFQTPDAQAALNDLVAKLQALGWQQETVGIPSPWYNLTFQRAVYQTSSIETSIVKAGQQDDFHNLFYAEDPNGNFQVAHSDKTFISSPAFPTPDVQVALDDLVAKLQALGWQQVISTLPSPWYSLTFQQLVFQTPQNP